MGFGLVTSSRFLALDQYPEFASYRTGTGITTARCRELLQEASNVPIVYTGSFVKEEMLCATTSGDQQLCEVRQVNHCIEKYYSFYYIKLST